MVNCTDPRASGWAHDASTGWLTWQGMCATTVPPAGEWERSKTMCKHFLRSSQNIQRAARTQAPQVVHNAHTHAVQQFGNTQHNTWPAVPRNSVLVPPHLNNTMASICFAFPPVHYFTLSGMHVCSQTTFAFTTPSR
jgi:hypothetical protein